MLFALNDADIAMFVQLLQPRRGILTPNVFYRLYYMKYSNQLFNKIPISPLHNKTTCITFRTVTLHNYLLARIFPSNCNIWYSLNVSKGTFEQTDITTMTDDGFWGCVERSVVIVVIFELHYAFHRAQNCNIDVLWYKKLYIYKIKSNLFIK